MSSKIISLAGVVHITTGNVYTTVSALTAIEVHRIGLWPL